MATILIVEDDAGMREALAGALARDHLVQATGSSERAIHALRSKPFDVVLLDMVLPDGTGFDVLSAATALRPKPHVVVLTVLDAIPKAVKAMQLGAGDYLVKPCQLDDLHAAIGGVLRGGVMAMKAG